MPQGFIHLRCRSAATFSHLLRFRTFSRFLLVAPQVLITLAFTLLSGCSEGPDLTKSIGQPSTFESDIAAAVSLEATGLSPGKWVFDFPEEFGDPMAEWTALTEGDSEATFSIVEDGLHRNGYALQVDVGSVSKGNPWDIQTFLAPISVKPNYLHTYSVWIKGPRGSQMNLGVEDLEYRPLEYKHILLTGAWQQVVFEFIPDQKSIRAPIHLAYAENEGASLLVDEFEIFQSE